MLSGLPDEGEVLSAGASGGGALGGATSLDESASDWFRPSGVDVVSDIQVYRSLGVFNLEWFMTAWCCLV